MSRAAPASPPTAARARRGERLRFPGVPAPPPRLAPERVARLSPRQRELLDELEELFAEDGFGGLTMAGIASRMNCSLRTLYGIAPSKEALVLAVVDRRLRRIGRAALEPLSEEMPALEALRQYLRAAHEAIQPSTAAYARELAAIPGAGELLDAHEGVVIAVVRALLERAVERGEIDAVDTAALALVLGGVGRDLARPAAAARLRRPARDAADEVVEIVIRGLERRRRPPAGSRRSGVRGGRLTAGAVGASRSGPGEGGGG